MPLLLDPVWSKHLLHQPASKCVELGTGTNCSFACGVAIFGCLHCFLSVLLLYHYLGIKIVTIPFMGIVVRMRHPGRSM